MQNSTAVLKRNSVRTRMWLYGYFWSKHHAWLGLMNIRYLGFAICSSDPSLREVSWWSSWICEIMRSYFSPSKYLLTVPALFQAASSGSFQDARVKQTSSYETNHLQVMKEELFFVLLSFCSNQSWVTYQFCNVVTRCAVETDVQPDALVSSTCTACYLVRFIAIVANQL